MRGFSINKRILLFVMVLVASWGLYLVVFRQVYQWDNFFKGTDTDFLTRLDFAYGQHPMFLVIYTVIGFILLNLTLTLVLRTHFLSRTGVVMNKYFTWFVGHVFVIGVAFLLTTTLWPLMLIIIDLSLAIAFVRYILKEKKIEAAVYGF